jgi:hypothetical protein
MNRVTSGPLTAETALISALKAPPTPELIGGALAVGAFGGELNVGQAILIGLEAGAPAAPSNTEPGLRI